MPEAQKIPPSHSLMSTSSRGPNVLSANRDASLAHRTVTAAKRAVFELLARRIAGLDMRFPLHAGSLVGFPIPRSMPPAMLLTTDRSNFIR
jgi:hypothetical protein